MATNWTLSQALAKITEGTDKAAIHDIGRRFPLTAIALAEIGQNAGAVKIIGAVPSHVTARKIESVLKDGVEQDPDVDTEDTEDEEETPKKENKKPAKKAAKANAEEDADDEEDDPVALYKKCKKAGIKVAPKKSAKYYKDQLAKAAAAEEDADEDDWGDEEEDEKPASKKKPVKKAPAKKTVKKAEPKDDEDEDEDEWDI